MRGGGAREGIKMAKVRRWKTSLVRSVYAERKVREPVKRRFADGPTGKLEGGKGGGQVGREKI